VEALRRNKADVVQTEMQPQLQRLVFILQDTQDRIRAKDREISRLKAQLLSPGPGADGPPSPSPFDTPRTEEREKRMAREVERLVRDNDALKRAAAEAQELLQVEG
jgi:hypothetical protein